MLTTNRYIAANPGARATPYRVAMMPVTISVVGAAAHRPAPAIHSGAGRRAIRPTRSASHKAGTWSAAAHSSTSSQNKSRSAIGID